MRGRAEVFLGARVGARVIFRRSKIFYPPPARCIKVHPHCNGRVGGCEDFSWERGCVDGRFYFFFTGLPTRPLQCELVLGRRNRPPARPLHCEWTFMNWALGISFCSLVRKRLENQQRKAARTTTSRKSTIT